jgi:hypothetical protein
MNMKKISLNIFSPSTFSTVLLSTDVQKREKTFSSFGCVRFSKPYLVIDESSRFFYFFIAFPFSPYWSACFFLSFFPFMCGGASGYFPLSSHFSFLDNTTRNTAHPAWDLNPADLAVVSEECRSSFHHPTVSP